MNNSASFSHDTLSEEDVGITEFSGNAPGFFGIIKQRFSDFLVNEIDVNGEDQHLTDLRSMPKCPHLDDDTNDVPASDLEPPQGVGPEIIEKIQKLLATSNSKDCAVPVLVPVTDISKERRAAIHKYFNKAYKGLISSTVDEAGQKYIKVTLGSEVGLRREKKRRTAQHLRLCLRFLMYKENMDTMEAVSRLAAKLRINVHKINYAGTKDRRAKTVQLMSVSDITPERLVAAARSLPRVMVGNLHYHRHHLALGALAGNAFTIVLREVKGDDAAISSAVASVGRSGAINYYGMQRFGSRAGHTHVVGRYLLLAQWQKAVETILKPSPLGDAKNAALQQWHDKKISAAQAARLLETCGARGNEHTLLRALAELGDTDWLGALNRLPRNTRTLYLYAYQSYLWNKVVSTRIRTHGLAVLPGDLVSVRESLQGGEVAMSEESSSASAGQLVRRLEEHQISSTDVKQVVIPAVGYAVMMPENDVTRWYKELLAEDGLSLASFKHQHKGYAVCGAYRAMLVVPKNLSHRICYYTDPLLPLVPSDADILKTSKTSVPLEENSTQAITNGSTCTKSSNILENHDIAVNAELQQNVSGEIEGGEQKENSLKDATENDDKPSSRNSNPSTGDVPEKNHIDSHTGPTSEKSDEGARSPIKALVLRFSLPPAAYATMVLRELLKMHTGAQFHASLNTPSSGGSRKRLLDHSENLPTESQDPASPTSLSQVSGTENSPDETPSCDVASVTKKPKMEDCDLTVQYASAS